MPFTSPLRSRLEFISSHTNDDALKTALWIVYVLCISYMFVKQSRYKMRGPRIDGGVTLPVYHYL